MDLLFQMGLALIRKLLFAALLLGIYVFIDRKLLKGFNTAEAIKNAPLAIALLLGLLAVAVSIS